MTQATDSHNQVSNVPSAASDVVMCKRDHPQWEDGGPCDDCAFRSGSSANESEFTVALARLCVEGFRPFYCHWYPGLCRGYIAALNIRGVPQDEEDRRWCVVAGEAADLLGRISTMARGDAEDAVEQVAEALEQARDIEAGHYGAGRNSE